MRILIYAFKKDQGEKKSRREKYSRDEGIIFIINGQAQGFFSKSFFGRKSVDLSYLDDSILVLVDCTKFEAIAREDLFMTSRDRLSEGELKDKIENQLEELLKKHQGLGELNERRREAIEGKIGDSKPLVEIIEKVIRRSPTLSRLFVEGVKLSNPIDFRDYREEDKDYKGKRFPTFLKLKKDYNKESPKHSPINRKFRVQFETDAENEYFERDSYPGEFSLHFDGETVDDCILNLWNGIANLTVKLPDWANVGDVIHFECEVEDIEHAEPFFNEFYVKVEEPQKEGEGKPGERKKPRSKEMGGNRKGSSSLDIPVPLEVKKEEWEMYGFTKETALSVKYGGEGKGYDFYVNVDNIHLQTEIKGNPKIDPKILNAQYKFGMVLIGLALLKEFEKNEKNEKKKENGNIYREISAITQAISPFLLPMISSLGEIEVSA